MFEHGNAHADGAPFGHWFVGDVERWAQQRREANPSQGLRQAADIEIKWGFHPKGEQREDWAGCSTKRTLSALVRGRFLIRFRSPDDRPNVKELRLLKEGDYAIWDARAEHIWIAEEDAVILTVRWTEASASNA
jgi:hypothetical protein